MGVVHRSPLAEQDHRDIWRYIAADNPDADGREVGVVRGASGDGESSRRVGSGLRSFPVGNYVVFYRAVADGIELVRVLHGARNFKRLFKP